MTRDYIYIGDVAEAFIRAVEYEGKKSIFNISSGVGTSLNELVDLLETVLDREIVRLYRPGRRFDVPVGILDKSLAKQELGWVPQIRIEAGIVKTVDWMLKELTK